MIEVWKKVLNDPKVGLEAKFGGRLSYEQLNDVRHIIACAFDDENGRWKKRRLPDSCLLSKQSE